MNNPSTFMGGPSTSKSTMKTSTSQQWKIEHINDPNAFTRAIPDVSAIQASPSVPVNCRICRKDFLKNLVTPIQGGYVCAGCKQKTIVEDSVDNWDKIAADFINEIVDKSGKPNVGSILASLQLDFFDSRDSTDTTRMDKYVAVCLQHLNSNATKLIGIFKLKRNYKMSYQDQCLKMLNIIEERLQIRHISIVSCICDFDKIVFSSDQIKSQYIADVCHCLALIGNAILQGNCVEFETVPIEFDIPHLTPDQLHELGIVQSIRSTSSIYGVSDLRNFFTQNVLRKLLILFGKNDKSTDSGAKIRIFKMIEELLEVLSNNRPMTLKVKELLASLEQELRNIDFKNFRVFMNCYM